MKVSTDGILLGCLAPIEEASDILDIGTGTGVLALMAAQRNRSAVVTALDIDHAACEQAKENIDISPWSDRIDVIETDVREHTGKTYDAIICNPPYYEGDLHSPDATRNQAKHSTHISLTELLACVTGLLTPQGKASFILPKQREAEVLGLMKQHGLFVSALTDIQYQIGQAIKRIVFTSGLVHAPLVRSSLVVQHEDNTYTAEYLELARPFLRKTHSD